MEKTQEFLTALNQYKGLVFKVASIYTNTIEDRNDVVQEITYQLWKSFNTFQHKSGLSTWIYRVAMNTAIHHLKIGRKRIQPISLDEKIISFEEEKNSEMDEKWAILKHHINRLDLLDKGIVVLYLEDKSYEEIGQIIGISTSNVGTKLSRIKEKLKEQISKNR